jgi:hypothetical protein
MTGRGWRHGPRLDAGCIKDTARLPPFTRATARSVPPGLVDGFAFDVEVQGYPGSLSAARRGARSGTMSRAEEGLARHRRRLHVQADIHPPRLRSEKPPILALLARCSPAASAATIHHRPPAGGGKQGRSSGAGAEVSAEKAQREMKDLSDQIRAAMTAMDAAKDDAERSVLRQRLEELKNKLRELKRDAYNGGR